MSGSLNRLATLAQPVYFDPASYDRGVTAARTERRNALTDLVDQRAFEDAEAVRALRPGLAAAEPNALLQLAAINPAAGAQFQNFQNARQDQQYQQGQRQLDILGRLAGAVEALPEGSPERLAREAVARQTLAGMGISLATDAPITNAQIAAWRAGGMTVQQQVTQQQNQLGPMPGFGPAPASAPASFPAPGAPVEGQGFVFQRGTGGGPMAQRTPVYSDPDALARRDALLDATPEQLAAESERRARAVGQPTYNPATVRPDAPVPGWDAGLPAPTGRINPNVTQAQRTGGVQVAGPGAPTGGGGAAVAQPQGGFPAGLVPLQRNGQPDTEGLPQGQMWLGRQEGGRWVRVQAGNIPGARQPGGGAGAAGSGGPFGGTAMDAQVANMLLTLGPRVQAGTATPEEQRQYEVALTFWLQQHATIDAGTGQLTTITRPPLSFAPQPGQTGMQPTQSVSPGGAPPQAPSPAAGPAPVGMPGAPPVTGQPRQVAPGVTVQQATPGRQNLTEQQSKDLVYLRRGAAANLLLGQMGNNLTMTGGAQGLRGIPDALLRGALPEGIGNTLVSGERQQAEQAAREFLASILRKDTGAAVTAQEFEIYGRTFLPQPGDSDATLRQKATARETALHAIRLGLGSVGGLADVPTPRAAPGGGGSAPGAPPLTERRVGQTYDTPRGPMVWSGTGWRAAQ